MKNTKIQGKFYPLKIEEWLNVTQKLNYAELKILFYLRSIDPYNNGIEVSSAQIARDLSAPDKEMHRSTVSRALKSLACQDFIDLELLQIRFKVKAKGFLTQEQIVKSEETTPNTDLNNKDQDFTPQNPPPPDPVVVYSTTTTPSEPSSTVINQPINNQNQQLDPVVTKQPVASEQQLLSVRNNCCLYATIVAPTQQTDVESKTEQGIEKAKKNKTFKEFIDSLSQEEKEKFLNFVRDQIKNFSRPIIDICAWLAGKTKAGENRWEVYYQDFEKAKPQLEKQELYRRFHEQHLRELEEARIRGLKIIQEERRQAEEKKAAQEKLNSENLATANTSENQPHNCGNIPSKMRRENNLPPAVLIEREKAKALEFVRQKKQELASKFSEVKTQLEKGGENDQYSPAF